jgi:hypothetical protein
VKEPQRGGEGRGQGWAARGSVVVWWQLGLRLKGDEEGREMGKSGGLNGFGFSRRRGNVEGVVGLRFLETKRKHGGSGLLWLNCGAGLVEIDIQH